MSSVTIWNVPGMSCEHCVAAITAEVGAIDDVDHVAVDLGAKLVTVTGGQPAAIAGALDEAGFDALQRPQGGDGQNQ